MRRRKEKGNEGGGWENVMDRFDMYRYCEEECYISERRACLDFGI